MTAKTRAAAGATSLRLRLGLGAAAAILLALGLSGFFLSLLFERHVLRRVDQELTAHLAQLAAALEIGPDGAPELSARLADPRFERPLSGLYWQVETETGPALRSRSLWDHALDLGPFDPADPRRRALESDGPDGERLLALARVVFFETASGDRPFRLAAALDRGEIADAQSGFISDLTIAFGVLASALLGAALLQNVIGLRPLRLLRERVAAVRTGAAARLEGRFPSEVSPLIVEMNALLSANDRMVERARESAADLAHGLKTPLAVLQAEARSLSEAGRPESAAEIEEQIEAMRARIERHLAAVRLRGPTGGAAGRADLAAGFEKLLRAMKAMPRGGALDWRLDAPRPAWARIDQQDFFEIFGNLLDNARKWAASEVVIAADRSAEGWRIRVDDDGPGVPAEGVEAALSRGGRLDEHRTGAGLGLAIATRALDAYGGALSLSNRPEGGARLEVMLPHGPEID